MCKKLDGQYPGIVHYSIMSLEDGANGMEALREIFPEAQANAMNFVLFSTSGVHGTYRTIEDAERVLRGDGTEDDEGQKTITFLVVHPRLVAMRFGNCEPETQDDIDFLKRLRQSSHEAVSVIGV